MVQCEITVKNGLILEGNTIFDLFLRYFDPGTGFM